MKNLHGVVVGALLAPSRALIATPLRASIAAARHTLPALSAVPPPEPSSDEAEVSKEETLQDLDADFEAGLAFGKEIKARFVAPRIDDPGLPYADALVCICGALFLAQLGLLGVLPRQSWLTPLPGVPLEGYRGLPFILPALSHGAGLAGCWVLGALSAAAFEREAYMGSWREALGRTWRGGSFATGVLLLSTQLATAVRFSAMGLDPYGPLGASAQGDYELIKTAFEVICDIAVQCVGLTAFRYIRWRDAQQYK